MLSPLALCMAAVLCLWLLGTPSSARATPPPLISHPAWQRLDALSAEFPYTWGRRYLELKALAEEADGYVQQLPLPLARLDEVTKLAHQNVIALLLDLVPASANVQETSFILGMLQGWMWRLEPPLQRTGAIAAGLEHSLELLESIGQTVTEMQIRDQKRPIMEKANQDFADMYTAVLRRVQQLHTDLNAVRSSALGLYRQIETASSNAEKHLAQRWFAYYTTPLIVSSRAFLRLGTDAVSMCKDWSSDEYSSTSLLFALTFNIFMLTGLLLAHAIAARVAHTAPHAPPKRSFAQSLCGLLVKLDIWHKVAFGFCIMVTLNTIVHSLPMLHKGIPYLFIQQVAMVVALAVWARTASAAPKVWELALAPATGLLFIHGDAGALLIVLGVGGSIVLTLTSMLCRSLRNHQDSAQSPRTAQSALHTGWAVTLLLGLLLTVMGFGRLTTALLMLMVVVCAAAAMLKVVNSSTSLVPHTATRVWFVPLFTVFLCAMSVSFLVACPGFDTLRNYWNANAIPFMGVNVTFGGLILTILSLLGFLFVSKISKQILGTFIRTSHALDASAIPVLFVVIDFFLFIILVTFIMSGMGIDVTSLAFIGGGVSIGVGFAAKTVLGNFFCGLVIIFSKVVRAGDQVEIGGTNGRVLSVNMRATVVETLSNGIMLVPNEEMLQSRLINWSLNNLHVLEDIAVSVAPDSNVESTLAVLEKAAAQVEGVLAEPAPMALFIGFGPESIECILKVWVKDIRTKGATLSAVHIALRQALAENGIVLSALVAKRLSIHMEELCADKSAQ